MWKIMWKIISVVFFSGLLIFACIAIYFNDKKIISRETLFDNVPFTKKLFSDKKIDNIVFNIDTNKITVYFPSDQYMDIFDFSKMDGIEQILQNTLNFPIKILLYS